MTESLKFDSSDNGSESSRIYVQKKVSELFNATQNPQNNAQYQHLLNFEIRVSSWTDNVQNKNIAFEQIDFPDMGQITPQCKSIVKNMLAISESSGGESFIAPEGGLFIILPYSPTSQFMLNLQFNKQLLTHSS